MACIKETNDLLIVDDIRLSFKDILENGIKQLNKTNVQIKHWNAWD